MAKTSPILQFIDVCEEDILLTSEKVVVEIYKITCKITGKSYVGQAVSHILNHGKYRRYGSKGRFRSHISEAITNTKDKQCKYLNNAIRKYGKDNFTYKTVLVCLKEDADRFETKNIIFYNTLAPNGYNLKLGGQNFQHTEISRSIVSEGVKKYFDGQRYEKFKNITIPSKIDPLTIIHPLRRNGEQYGFYVLYNHKGMKIKSDFGGVMQDISISLERAVNFVKFLQSKK